MSIANIEIKFVYELKKRLYEGIKHDLLGTIRECSCNNDMIFSILRLGPIRELYAATDSFIQSRWISGCSIVVLNSHIER